MKEILVKKRISFKNIKKKIYISVQAFNRLTDGVSAFYEILKSKIWGAQNNGDNAETIC